MLGIVVKSTGSWYTVRLDDGTYCQSRIKGKFRIGGLKVQILFLWEIVLNFL